MKLKCQQITLSGVQLKSSFDFGKTLENGQLLRRIYRREKEDYLKPRP